MTRVRASIAWFDPAVVGVVVGCAALLAAASGCQTTAQHRAREDATKQWNIARARVKAHLAQERFDAGDVDTAATELAEARRLNPDDRSLDPLYIRVLLSQGKFVEAERQLEIARAAIGTHRLCAHTSNGGSEGSNGGSPGSIENSPGSAPGHGGLLGDDGLEENATSLAASSARAPSPSPADATEAELAYLTGVLRQEQGRWAEAQAEYARACALAPEDEQYLIDLARAHLQRGQAPQALAVLTRGGRSSGSRVYFRTLAETWEALDNPAEAATAWQQAAAGATPGRASRERLASALRRAGRLAEAAQVFEELLREADAAAARRYRTELAHCHLALRRPGEAAAQAQAVLQEDPHSGAATVVLAHALAMQGESDGALRVVHQGLAREPGSRVLLELQAALQWSRQEPDAASKTAQRLNAIEPGNEVAAAILQRAAGRSE